MYEDILDSFFHIKLYLLIYELVVHKSVKSVLCKYAIFVIIFL